MMSPVVPDDAEDLRRLLARAAVDVSSEDAYRELVAPHVAASRTVLTDLILDALARNLATDRAFEDLNLIAFLYYMDGCSGYHTSPGVPIDVLGRVPISAAMLPSQMDRFAGILAKETRLDRVESYVSLLDTISLSPLASVARARDNVLTFLRRAMCHGPTRDRAESVIRAVVSIDSAQRRS